MKKLLLTALAVAALASCMKEQTLDTLQPGAITFDGAFVENVTRANDPSKTTGNLTEFYVWAVMNANKGIVFNDEKVSGSQSGWSYTNTQYWTPSNYYYFSALAGDRTNDQIVIDYACTDVVENGSSTKGLGTLTFTNVDGTNDVLYAEAYRKTDATITSQPAAVKFQFDHLLSKVKFSFVNGFVNANNTVVVKNIKMVVPGKGTINLAESQIPTIDAYTWTDHAESTTLDMGHMSEGANVTIGQTASSDNERLTIPATADQEYTVTFDVELWMGEVKASEAKKTVKINGCALEPGKAYNFKAILNEKNIDENPLFPITFEAEVDEWVEAPVYDGGVIPTNAVSTAAELAAALNKGGLVTLARDIEVPATLVLDQNVVTVLDLNGKSITVDNDSSELGKGDGIIATAGKLTITGEGSVTANTRAVWARGNGGAEIIIENGSFTGATKNFKTEVIYASGNGKITILDGTFEAVTLDDKSYADPQYAVLNIHGNGKDGCDIDVYGGTFKNFNPADNVSENPKAGYHNSNFCADDYVTIEKNGVWSVIKGKTDVSTVTEFETALAANIPNVTLLSDLELNSQKTVVSSDLTLNLNGHSLTCERNVGPKPTAADISTLYVEGARLTITGEGSVINEGEKGGYGIAVKNGTLIIKGDVTVGSYYDAIYVNNASLFIEDGFFYTLEPVNGPDPALCELNYKTDPSSYCHRSTVINCQDDSRGEVSLTGGTYVNMDPSDVHEWRLHNQSFVADGYKAVGELQANGQKWYTVIPE